MRRKLLALARKVKRKQSFPCEESENLIILWEI